MQDNKAKMGAHDSSSTMSKEGTTSPGQQNGAFLDLKAEISRLRNDPSVREDAGHKAKMLAKYPEFRIVLITMRAGSRWDDHKTSSRIFVNPLEGQIRFHTPDGSFDMREGQLITLDPDIQHSVDSPEESAFLLTLASAKQS